MRPSLLAVAAFSAVSSGYAVNISNTPAPINQGLAGFSDINILQFSLYLENFSSAFYRQGLANYTQAEFAKSGFDADFYSNLTTIASHHDTHVTSLAATLGYLNAPLLKECTYAFNDTNPLEFVITSTLIQGVSVSAYLGSVALIQDTSLATLIASILSVEARHSAYVRAALGEQPFAGPFDVPLTLNEAYELAFLYTPSCPKSNPSLHLRTFPQMSSSFSNYGVVGGDITLLTFGQDIQPAEGSDEIYAAFLTITGPIFALATPVSKLGFKVTVPKSPIGYAPIAGFTYVVLTSKNTTLSDDDILAGPASLEIHPS